MTNVKTLPNIHEQAPENDMLMEKTEVFNTPFVVISIKEKHEHFGTLGNYRITEVYSTKEEAIKGTEAITWNRIIQLMTLVIEIIKKQEGTK